MANDSSAVPVRDNPAESRYEADLDGALAMIVYELRGDTITMFHTEVPEDLEGRGIASTLARFALEDARSRALRVIPQCQFIAGYIRRHPEYESLVARR